jgi:cytochrome o ubiquinol oxidase subunit 1
MYAFWCWIIGFFISFLPLYILGFMGATRRLDHYDAATGWQPLFIIAALGFVIIACGAAFQILQGIVSVKQRKQNLDTTGDPWNGRTLEWATASPPPVYNFALIPKVRERDAFWDMKKANSEQALPAGRQGIAKSEKYEDIIMPKNTAMGIYISGFAFLFAFALIWHITWLVLVGLVGAIACVIIRSFDEGTEYRIPAREVAKIETKFAQKKLS